MTQTLSIGCQTYTWEMRGPDWTGTPDDILDIVAAAGYAGAEFTNNTIAGYADAPERFAEALSACGLCCAGFASNGFTDPAFFERDLAGAERALHFCAALRTMLCLGGAASPTREEYDAKLEQAVRLYRTVAERGAALGVTVCVHPHSHYGSLLESAEEYDRLLALTEDSGLMFNPDAGHITRGGQDLLECLRRHRERIAHVHIKDADARNEWQALGRGIIPWQAVLDFLRDSGYTGWVVAEEESAEARRDPVGAVVGNRRYLRSLGY
jgi:sugar phosphate isomerase/epimerase